MPERKTSEEELDLTGFWQQHRRQVLAGAAGLLFLALLLAYGAHRLLSPPAVVPQAAAEIGTADMREVLKAHPDYQKLEDLRGQILAMETSLAEVPEIIDLPALVQPPTVDGQPFEDSVFQKNAHTVIGGRVQLERERKQLEQQYREQTRAAYEAQRDALDEEYLNAILNLNLKLDNQEQMHHPWTSQAELEAERAAWQQEMQALKQERGERQHELRLAWDKQVADYVAGAMAPKLAEWDAKSKATLDQQRSEALSSKAAAQARAAELMEKQMQASAQVQSHLQKREELIKLRQDLAALETHIYNDIAGRAAKVAIMHHFTLLLGQQARTRQDVWVRGLEELPLPEYQAALTSVYAEDVTEELVQEVKSLASGNP